MLEILRHYGHDVVGNDFANMASRRAGQEMSQFRDLNDENFSRTEDDIGLPIEGVDEIDWPYRHIVESIDLPMKIFDAGHVPYPFEDKQFDVVICSQAIEHYCHPKDWMPIVDEFCRVSRKSVFVLLNRLIPEFRAKPEYNDAFTEFRHGMRTYNKGGFQCVGSFVHWDQALGFKLMAL
jgi:SAM-dependent methyltransferase